MKGFKTIGMILFMLFGSLMLDSFVGIASEFNFAVTPLPSEHQIDKEKTYFDLLLAPSQTTELKATLRNDTEKEVKVDVSVNNATTNSNVIVEYGENALKKDKSLAYDLKEHVHYPESVVLKPKSEQTVPFRVDMPNKSFDGVIAGGITFKEEPATEEKTTKSTQGLSIENDYSYVVALLMRQNQKKVVPNLVLHEVKPSQINARNVILAALQNDQKTYINQVALSAKVTKKGSDKVLYQEEKENLQIAPNSSFSLPVSLKKQALKPGVYHMSLSVSGNKDGSDPAKFENHWTFERDFRIDGDTAKELNEKDVTLKPDYTWLYILIGFFLLLASVLIILFIRRNKQADTE